MGIMRLIEGIRARKTVSVFSCSGEYLFTAGKSDPACPDGFWKIGIRRRPEAVPDRTGPDKGPFLFFDSRTNRFLDFTGGLLETLFPMSSEHFYDMAVLEQEVNLRVNRYIAHNLIYKIQEGAAKYGWEEFDEGEIREQAYVCYMTGACGHLRVPAQAFDMGQFCRMDRRQDRAGEGPFVEDYARLMMLHLSEQFPSGEVAGSFLEDRCRKGTECQRNYDVICREYAKNCFVEQELEYLMKEATDSMKRAKSLCQLLKAKGSVKPQVEVEPDMLIVSLASDCAGPVIGRKRDVYYS
ncbi:MAG: hypothetical protein LUK37_08985 [Clostridia bacterium]|nr:hypothetical protein [Clostridia bacterium]